MKVLDFGPWFKRRLAISVCVVLAGATILAGMIMCALSARAGDEPASEAFKKPALNNWTRATDWDGIGEKPSSYQVGGIKRLETVPDAQIFKKLLRDMPVGMGAYVHEEALKLDATRHGWLRADAVVCDQFDAHEFSLYVTRWEGGYYVHPSRSFEEGKGTYSVKDGFIPVKAFCWQESCCYIIQVRDLELKDPLKGLDPATSPDLWK